MRQVRWDSISLSSHYPALDGKLWRGLRGCRSDTHVCMCTHAYSCTHYSLMNITDIIHLSLKGGKGGEETMSILFFFFFFFDVAPRNMVSKDI